MGNREWGMGNSFLVPHSRFPTPHSQSSPEEVLMSLMNAAEEIRFPVGDFVIDPVVTNEKRRRWIAEMAQTPANLRVALAGLRDDQLDTPYREGGWTLRQVV